MSSERGRSPIHQRILRYLALRAATNRQANYQAGWDYAAGQLIAGGATELLEAQVDTARIFGTATDFDTGIIDAVRAWDLMHTKKEDL
jgi:hypothetical protein